MLHHVIPGHSSFLRAMVPSAIGRVHCLPYFVTLSLIPSLHLYLPLGTMSIKKGSSSCETSPLQVEMTEAGILTKHYMYKNQHEQPLIYSRTFSKDHLDQETTLLLRPLFRAGFKPP